VGIDYYNKQQKGLGKRFSETINNTILKIQELPQSASIAFDTVRYKVVGNYPYIITYEYDRDAIFILRIFNTHQHPESL
jgi:hypothetical protein